MSKKRVPRSIILLLGLLALGGILYAAQISGLWTVGGQNINNTRNQASETRINVNNAGSLATKWQTATAGDVSATPAVDGSTVYIPDWKGNLYAIDSDTGSIRWQVAVQNYTGVPPADPFGGVGGVVRATPAIAGDLLIMGDQGGRLGQGAKVLAVDRKTGAKAWVTQIQGNGADPTDSSAGAQFAIVTQSAIVDANDPKVAYIGTASWEEAMSAFIPGYVCCTFRGSVVALDVKTGAVLWRTYMSPSTPVGYSGNGVWGSTGTIDPQRRTIYVTTGNNYSVPQGVANCVAAATTDDQKRACIAPDDYFDSIVALDINTGAVRWATKAIPYDAWNVNCIPGFGMNPCPEPAGPDYDFGQGPGLFRTKINGKFRDLIGAGQKSGQYWALDRDTGAVVWVTQVGPGGTMGGLQWGSAIDDQRIYVAVNNSNAATWTPLGGAPTNKGAWTALDPATGAILWQTATPDGPLLVFGAPLGSAIGAMTAANGVVYGCSFAGTWTAMNGQTGAVVWSRNSGAACGAGAAVVQGTVYWGTGYNQIMFAPIQPSALYAFGLQ